MKRRKVTKAIILGILLCVAAGIGYLYYSYSTRVYKHCVIEAGTPVTAQDFLKDPSKEAVFVTKQVQADVSIPGDYEISLCSGLFNYHCILTVQDTIAPKADVTEVETAYGTAVSADAFIGNITDATAVTVRFKEEPDFCRYGEQKVTVLLEDLGGNVTSYESSLLISPVKEETELEIGSEVPTVSDFLQEEAIKVLLPAGEAADGKAVLLSDVSEADMLALGEKTVYIRAEGHVFESMLRIVDTIPPVFSVHEVSAYTTSLLTAEQFVTEAEDATALTFYFQKDPVLAEGTQEVVIVAKDEGGNTTEAVASLTLKADTEAPVMKGVANRTVYIGDGISYKAGVTVTDNCDEDIELQVDSSGVDLNTEGNYHVTYSAKDRAGNETSQTITLTVRKHAYTQEEVDVLADKVLADIITPEMSDYDKLVAIYDWVRTHVSYINYSEKGDWIRGAYEWLALHQGDCYVYFATSKELLTRAGIANRDIEKIPTRSHHYWNLVDIGEGWYHFDTCPRTDHPRFCYVDDATLMEYSNAHYRSHNYDRTIYTDIQ